ncbi:MAG: 50S ribosomal protein L6 [Armatimonadota bacterium]|nr:50S ribosomal protein L6 [Armatimonadota bacterium]
MSRIGESPIQLPAGVTVELVDHRLTVKGPKGELSRHLHEQMDIVIEEPTITVRRPSESKEHRSLHGLTRTLAANMVIGVTEGYEKVLDLHGVGFRIQQQGQRLTLQIGFSHPVVIDLAEGISGEVDTFVPTGDNSYLSARLTLRGIDKELLGQTAATIRATKKPEPYKGKGFRYRGEHVRRKAGKAAQATAQ